MLIAHFGPLVPLGVWMLWRLMKRRAHAKAIGFSAWEITLGSYEDCKV